MSEPVELHERQHLADPPVDRLARMPADLQRIGDVAGNRHVGKKRVALEHHAEVALLREQRRNGCTIEHDVAARWRFEPGNHHQKRRLAGAGRSKQGDELPRLDDEIHAVDSFEGAEALDHAGQRKAARRSPNRRGRPGRAGDGVHRLNTVERMDLSLPCSA